MFSWASFSKKVSSTLGQATQTQHQALLGCQPVSLMLVHLKSP